MTVDGFLHVDVACAALHHRANIARPQEHFMKNKHTCSRRDVVYAPPMEDALLHWFSTNARDLP
jgi:hypothetical protein